MAGDFVEKLQSLLRPVTEELAAGTTLEIRHFFGGAAAYANGRICISLTPAGLALKLPPHCRAELIEIGAKPLRYFANAPIKKQYVIVPPEIHKDEEQLTAWARKSIAHVLTLPPPKRRSHPRPGR